MLSDDHRRGVALDDLKEEEKFKQKFVYKDDLEGQLAEQEMKRQEQYEEFLKEKLMIDEICRKIYEEDQKELEAKLQKQTVTRQYIDQFLQKREEVRYKLVLLEVNRPNVAISKNEGGVV